MVIPGAHTDNGKCAPPLGITLPFLSALILWSDNVNDDKGTGVGKECSFCWSHDWAVMQFIEKREQFGRGT